MTSLRRLNSVLLAIAILLFLFILNSALDGINLNSAQSATRPCSTSHTCLKNHTYPTYCTGSTGNSQTGYNVVPCPSSTVQTTPQSKNTPTASPSSTATRQDTKKSQNQGISSNNGSSNDSQDTQEDKQDTLKTTLQKLGPYYPNQVTVQKMQDRIKAVNNAVNSNFKPFNVHVVIDIFKGSDGSLVAITACYYACTEQTSTDSTSVYAIVTMQDRGKTVIIQPLILIPDDTNVTVNVEQDYIAVNELGDRGHFYIMFD